MDLNFRIYSFELRILETFTDSLKTIPLFFLDIKIILLTLFVCHLYMFASLVTVGHTKASKMVISVNKKNQRKNSQVFLLHWFLVIKPFLFLLYNVFYSFLIPSWYLRSYLLWWRCYLGPCTCLGRTLPVSCTQFQILVNPSWFTLTRNPFCLSVFSSGTTYILLMNSYF